MPPHSKPTVHHRRASGHIPSAGQTIATQPQGESQVLNGAFEGALFTYACGDGENLFRALYVLGNGKIVAPQALDDVFAKFADMSVSRAQPGSLDVLSNTMNDVEERDDEIDDNGGDNGDMEWSDH